MSNRPYSRLLLMVVLSFISMYVLMYAMVDAFANVYLNNNQFYMAGLMAAPMAIIELALMRALIVFWLLIRQQTAIADKQFPRSMIPHHAGAILMCEQAPIADAEIKELCKAIISSQQAEINQMKATLNRLER
jgi:uncharacterized protein (DUF305 family)